MFEYSSILLLLPLLFKYVNPPEQDYDEQQLKEDFLHPQ